MTTSPVRPRRPARTKVLTSLSIFAIALTGAVAVGANLGILDAADANTVGKLSAAGDLAPTRRVIDVYPDQPTPAIRATTVPAGPTASTVPGPADPVVAPAPAAVPAAPSPPPVPAAAPSPPSTPAPAPPPTTALARAERFTVDVAGSVNVSGVDGGVRLDQVAPAPGWTWALTRSGPGAVAVALSNGSRSLVFRATLAADGTIAATVDEPASSPVATAPPLAGHGGSDHGGTEDD